MHLPSINSTMGESSEEDLSASISTLITSVDLSEASDGDAERAVRHRLCSYQPSGSDDDTVKILTACLDHLPLHGKTLLTHLIKLSVSDREIFNLSKHLVTAVLIPSIWLPDY